MGAVGGTQGSILPNFSLPAVLGDPGASPEAEAPSDSLKYPLEDREGDFVTDDNDNPFDLDDPPSIEQNVEYDPETNTYIITETVGGQYYKPPTYMTFDEYWEHKQQEMNTNYWNNGASSGGGLSGAGLGNTGSGSGGSDIGSILEDATDVKYGLDLPKLYTGEELYNRLFGGTAVDIRPTGSIDMEFGFKKTRTLNPTLPTAYTNPPPSFLFDMGINMGVTGKIGDKLKIDLNYNTKAVFDFDNQVKLEYIGDEDEIVQEIRAGNVNFPLPTQLIPGSQNLFGIQTKLKFGRLTVNSVLSQQKSRPKNITLENGAQEQEFEISVENYDENRHFFLAHYFRDNYEKALSNLPYVNSDVIITRLDVYVNDTRGTPEDVQRDIVGFADLGECNPANPNTIGYAGKCPPDNESNNLYRKLSDNPSTRNLDQVGQVLETPGGEFGLNDVRDFRKTLARKLEPTEYTYDPQLGYVSLNFSLRPNEVLSVAYEYTTIYGGQYQVGEFAEDIFAADDENEPRVIFLKMLKSTSQIPEHPIWDLMMRNVYALGAYQVQAQDFKLDVYYENPGGGDLRYIPAGEGVKGIPLIRILNLDQLNSNNEPFPDGIFDFIPTRRDFEGQTAVATNTMRYGTINPKNGRLVFPVLEPFGENLTKEFCERGNPDNPDISLADCADSAVGEIARKYAYQYLYDSTKIVAMEHPEFSRFLIKGTYTSSISSEISLGAFNIPEGSVRITAGGKLLVEGVDYEINYSLGRLTILNEAYVNAGTPINVSYEDNMAFGLLQRTFLGTRLDYWISDNFTLGATAVRLSERPFTPKVNYGDDPIANSMIGLDGRYFTEMKGLTKALDKLPIYDTKETSSLTLTAEGASFIPGHARAIGKDGTVYIDDFEGSKTQYDLKFPYTAWTIASTPKNMLDENGVELFPEAILTDSLPYGYNRAKMSWYQVDNIVNRGGLPIENKDQAHYVRAIREQEVFPNTQSFTGQVVMRTFDMAYYPDEKGPYNFDTEPSPVSAGINEDGKLNEPETRWGGIMRNSPYKNFEQANVEFVEFWMMDPFLYANQQENEGELYLHLGNVSEDVLKDARQYYENGLPGASEVAYLDTTSWGVVPVVRPITTAFDNDVDTRALQDVGFDGLADADEQIHFGNYLNNLNSMVGTGGLTAAARDELLADPSSDNFLHFRDEFYENNTNYDFPFPGREVLLRYKDFNSPDGNSPILAQGATFTNSGTNLPEIEELNQDRALNDSEQYFQYRVPLKPRSEMQVGEGYLVDFIDVGTTDDNDSIQNVRWYYFRVPVQEPTETVGDINFRNIEFVRLVMTGFKQAAVCRFARLNMVRNTWRRYNPLIVEEGEYLSNDQAPSTFFNLSAVSFEENAKRSPIPYAIPDYIERVALATGTTAQNLLQNEQAISVQVGDLRDGFAKGIFKRLDMDMRQFKRLEMSVHAESLTTFGNTCDPIEDGDISVFIRLGDDFQENYYEYEIPLVVNRAEEVSNFGDDRSEFNYDLRDWMWPDINDINITLQDLVDVKVARNFDGNAPVNKPFKKVVDRIVYDDLGMFLDSLKATITVVGSPDMGRVKQVMLGVRNPKKTAKRPDDDGFDKCAELWFNELRLSEIDERAGYAAIARADLKLADLGNVTLAGNMHTTGFGTLEQRANQRFRDNFYQYDVSGNFELGKFLPKNWGIRIPFYAGISESISTPEYDPYDMDVKMKQNMDSIRANFGEAAAKEERKKRQAATTIKSINVTNMGKERTNPEKKPMPWDIENWSATIAYTKTESRDHIIESDTEERYKGSLGYTYTARPFYIEPFKKLIKSKSLYLRLIKDINFNLVPSAISFRNDVNTRTGVLQLRAFDPGEILTPNYDKQFTWDRNYGLKYNPTRSISTDFNVINRSVIDQDQYTKSSWQTVTDTLRAQKWWGGRTRNYEQNANISYNLPLDKFPLLSWTQVRTRYGSKYFWQGNPVEMADTLGNLIGNSRNIQVNGELNFTKLYNSIPALKKINSDRRSNKKKPRPKKPKLDKDGNELPEPKATKPKRNKNEASLAARILIRPLLMFRRASITYNDRGETIVPGYNRNARYLGSDWSLSSPRPGWDFIFGHQPDIRFWSEWAAGDLDMEDRILTNNQYLNEQLKQSLNRSVAVKVNLEPYKGLKIDLNMDINYSKNHSEFYKVDTSYNNEAFRHLAKIDGGSYTISYITIGTLFDKINADGIPTTFRTFESNREIVSQKFKELQAARGVTLGDYYDPINEKFEPNYAEGYGPYSPDVLLPAFIAAYSGRTNSDKWNLNPFNTFPLPNWRVTYNGFSKMPGIKEIFSAFNISHAYTSSISINNYRNNLDYDDRYYDPAIVVPNDDAVVDYLTAQETIRLANPEVDIDSLTGNFYSYFQIPQVMISEQLAPLIGIDMTLRNGITARFDYKKSRMLGMSFQDYQLSEQRSEEFTIGAGYKLTGLDLPFIKFRGEQLTLQNDLAFNFDFSIRDTRTLNYRLDQGIAEPTGGMRSVRLAPSIDYVVSNRLKVSLFYERTRNTPVLSTAFPTINSKGGIRVNLTLGQ